MRQIAVVCAIGVLLTGCGGGRRDSATRGPDGREALMSACGDAVRAANAVWAKTPGSFQDSVDKPSDDLKAAANRVVKACRPALSYFDVNSTDPMKARVSKTCQASVQAAIDGYDDMAAGVGGDHTAALIAYAHDQDKECTWEGHLMDESKAGDNTTS